MEFLGFSVTAPPLERAQAGSERQVFAWTLLIALLLCAALFTPFFFGKTYLFDDLGAFHFPLRAFYADCLAEGRAFDWIPHLFSGTYLTGEGQAGTYHPWHLLLYRLLPLEKAFAWELLACYPAMLAGTYLLFARHVIRRDAALLGAIAFTFSGFNLLHFMHTNAIAIVAHIPWILWLINRSGTDLGIGNWDLGSRAPRPKSQIPNPKSLLLISLLTASQLLLGYPQYVWFSLLAESAYAAALAFGRDSNVRWRPLIVAKFLGLAMGAIQLLPTVDALAASVRDSWRADDAFAGSLAPSNAAQLVAPYLLTTRVIGENTHELGLYAGAVPLILVVWLLSQWPRLTNERRMLVALVAMFGLAALLLAFGGFGPLYKFQTWLPLVGKFRAPCRTIVLVHLAIAGLAAIAFAELSHRSGGERLTLRGSWPLAAVVSLSIAIAIAAPAWFGADDLAPVPLRLAGPVLIALSAGAVFLATRWRPGLVLVVALTALDLGVYGLSYAVYPRATEVAALAANAKSPPTRPAERIAADLPPLDPAACKSGNATILWGASRLDGYLGLVPKRQLDYRDDQALRLAGVRWVRIPGQQDGWREIPNPLPRFRLLASSTETSNPMRDLSRIDVERTALVEQPLQLAPSEPGRIEVAADEPGRIRLRVACDVRQLLVVSESFHSGWRASIDGRQAETLRVNGDFLGCVVEPGEHDIELAFRPASLRLGTAISVLGLGVTFLWAVMAFRRIRSPHT